MSVGIRVRYEDGSHMLKAMLARYQRANSSIKKISPGKFDVLVFAYSTCDVFVLCEAGSFVTFILMVVGEPRESTLCSGEALLCLDGDLSVSRSFIGLARMFGEPCRGFTVP